MTAEPVEGDLRIRALVERSGDGSLELPLTPSAVLKPPRMVNLPGVVPPPRRAVTVPSWVKGPSTLTAGAWPRSTSDMKMLLILNEAAYGSDKTFNALRLAVVLARREDVEPRVFLMGDAVTCAVAGQKTPDGYYTLDRMLRTFTRHGGQVAFVGRAWTHGG